MTISIPNEYYNIVANIESGGNPNAVSSTSSASGLFGFLNSTAAKLGGNGQQEMQSLTQENAQALVKNGLAVTSQNLYTLHFLGQSQGLDVLNSPSNTSLNSVVSQAAIKANPQLSGLSVGQFSTYTANLTGGSAGPNGGDNTAQLAGTAAKEGSQFATDLATGNYIGALSDGVQDILGVFGIGDRKPGGNGSGSGSGSSSGNWFVDFFSAHTATRAAFIIIGIILVGVAVVYLAANSDTGKTVINNVKETAKTVATTAVVAA